MVRWQIWQRTTGRCVTVTGKRDEAEFFITAYYARSARPHWSSPGHEPACRAAGDEGGGLSLILGRGKFRRAARTVTIPCRPVQAWTTRKLPDQWRSSARSRFTAALIRARWVKAWGKFPSASPEAPICSA